MSFIKLKLNEMKEASVKTPNPREEEGQYGKQLMFDFIINGTDYTLSVSPSSAAVQDMKMFSAGDDVIIKKEKMPSGNTSYRIFPKNSIETLPQNQNLPSGKEMMQTYKSGLDFDERESNKEQLILRQVAGKIAGMVHSGTKNKPQIVCKDAEEYLRWLNGLELPF